jgi:hypothetical protein
VLQASHPDCCAQENYFRRSDATFTFLQLSYLLNQLSFNLCTLFGRHNKNIKDAFERTTRPFWWLCGT